MAIALLKMLTDSAWYLAFMAPILASLPNIARWILLLVPVVWVIYLAVFWKKRDFISDIQDVVLFEAKFLLGIGIAELLFIGPANWQTLCGRPVLLFLVFGIFLLRAGRIAGAAGEKRSFWRTSGISLLTALILAVVLTSETVRSGALWLLRALYNHLIVPIMEAFFWLVAAFCTILVTLFSMIFSGSFSAENQELLQMEFETPLEMEETAAAQTSLPIKAIGTLLLILAAAAVLFFLYRKLAGNAASWKQNAAGSISRSPDEEHPGSSRRPGFPGRRRNVRYYYRKFLQLCVKNGLNTERPLTSDDAHKFAVSSAAAQDPETSREFRDLYRRVRYGGEPEDEDTGKRAKELYQSFR
ncbi:MAG: hypothetical protein LIP12_18105 [Clostridiales bacterium]|nr:hypothetical protein [Clostridiales bacterium]